MDFLNLLNHRNFKTAILTVNICDLISTYPLSTTTNNINHMNNNNYATETYCPRQRSFDCRIFA